MDRHEADEALRKAILDHADAYDARGPGDLLSDVVVVAAWMPPDTDDDPRTGYSVQLLGGYLPHHVALGLLDVAEGVLVDQGSTAD